MWEGGGGLCQGAVASWREGLRAPCARTGQPGWEAALTHRVRGRAECGTGASCTTSNTTRVCVTVVWGGGLRVTAYCVLPSQAGRILRAQEHT